MIPIRDTVRARSFPVVNTLVILANVGVFLIEASLPQAQLERLVAVFGLVPAELWGEGFPARWWTLVTSIFIHGGWSHLFSNMLALYIFGDNVEDRLGHGRYLAFYLVGGALAGAAHLLAYRNSVVPTVGASGAIAAVLGAYVVLFPTARVITILPFPLLFPVVEVYAVVYLGVWFLSQVLNGLFSLAIDTFQGGGVAWWAHVGGFVAGLALARALAPRQARWRTYRDEYYPW